MIYAWIWKKLPGSKVIKIIEATLLIVAILFILWYLVFPNFDSYFSGDPSLSND
jgi:hypothetical protein